MNLGQLSIQNLRGKPFRTAGLVVIVAALAFTLSVGSVLVLSLENGADSVGDRLGADIMVVPRGNESKAESILIKGEPSMFYMSRDILDIVQAVPGVSQVSAQFYLTTISDDPCCDYPVQIIAFDPETDFTIQPWIAESYKRGISKGDIIVGSAILIDESGKVKFFGDEYPVVAQLERSGTGLDASVFITMDTVPQLVAGAVRTGSLIGKVADNIDSISTILVRVEDGHDVGEVANGIFYGDLYYSSPGVDVIQKSDVVSGLVDQMGSLIAYVSMFAVTIWTLSAVVLAVVFSVTAGERKKEFATFRMLGATRRKLAGIILCESVFIGLIGGIAGAVIAAIVVVPFSANIGRALDLPYVLPSSAELISVFVLALVLSLVVGVLTSLWSAVKMSRAETYVTMREGE
ncbi:MAG: ABC transporter permease [Candidatus Methanoplasma sp.]|jgi:putative ABC transport system permease protein|nr:ABC transporter permease [Candidatus Methanoplasma sp.]